MPKTKIELFATYQQSLHGTKLNVRMKKGMPKLDGVILEKIHPDREYWSSSPSSVSITYRSGKVLRSRAHRVHAKYIKSKEVQAKSLKYSSGYEEFLQLYEGEEHLCSLSEMEIVVTRNLVSEIELVDLHPLVRPVKQCVHLGQDVLRNILSFLSCIDLVKAQLVSREFQRIIRHEAMWKLYFSRWWDVRVPEQLKSVIASPRAAFMLERSLDRIELLQSTLNQDGFDVRVSFTNDDEYPIARDNAGAAMSNYKLSVDIHPWTQSMDITCRRKWDMEVCFQGKSSDLVHWAETLLDFPKNMGPVTGIFYSSENDTSVWSLNELFEAFILVPHGNKLYCASSTMLSSDDNLLHQFGLE